MGSEAKFLEYNKDNIFISLVQAEGHFRNLESGFAGRGEFLSCVSKHLAYAEGEAEEAVSHSLLVEGPTRSQEYAKLRNDLRELRKKIQAGAVGPEDGIREVRKIRAMFERLNPPFDTSQCRSCGSAEEVLKRLGDLKDVERDMAERVLGDLSSKYGVEPPKLEISDSCHEPNEGLYRTDGTIKMCRGGVNLHVLLHEFKHYYDHTVGKSLDEGDAEAFAVETVEKGLYYPSAKHNHSEGKMVSSAVKDVALVVGGVNIGWGVGYAAKAYIDPMAPGAIMGQDPSLLIDVGGTVAAIIGALKLRGDMAKKLSAYIAAGLSTHIWEDLAKALAPVAMAVGMPAAFGAPLGVRAVGETIPSMPAMPYPAARLAEYPFPSPVSVGGTMSPPHYTLNGVPGLQTVSLGPKYTLDTI